MLPSKSIQSLNWTYLLISTFMLNITKARKQVHYIHWNKSNPMFRLDNTDHMIDINQDNLAWEYDQVNIICPVSKADVKLPERHVIYSVSREEFDSCRITNPRPRIVAVCSKPHQLLYFTITFRSFSPTPGGLEFHPGKDYYFISTSSPEDLHRRVGGGCSTHNMKMIFKVSDNHRNSVGHESVNNHINNEVRRVTTMSPTTISTTKKPMVQFNGKVPHHRDYIYYYHPRDLIESDKSGLYNNKKGRYNHQSDNEVWKNEALRYTNSISASSTVSLISLHSLALISVILLLW